MSETRGIYTVDSDALERLARLLDQKTIAALTAQLEAVISLGQGDVAVCISGGKAVKIKTTVSKSLTR